MSALTDPLDDAQLTLLIVMAEPYLKSGQWPFWNYVEQMMDHLGHDDAEAVLKSLPVVASNGTMGLAGLWCYPDHIQIYVHDQDRTPPMLRPPSAENVDGRGLRLVEWLSSKWGYMFPTPHPDSAKAVWAQIDFPGNPAPTDVPDAA